MSVEILTPLQRDFLECFFEQTQDFFLIGGTALAAFYLSHRRSEDFDLFTLSVVDIRKALEWVRRKDAGVSAATLAYILNEVSFHRIPDYVLKPVTVDELNAFFSQLRDELVVKVFRGCSGKVFSSPSFDLPSLTD